MLLSEKERSVLSLVANGRKGTELCKMLGMKESAVREHLSKIIDKMGIVNHPSKVSMLYEKGDLTLN